MQEKFAIDFDKATKEAAEKISETETKIYLDGPFNGFFVSSLEPTEEKLKKNSELMKFRDLGIDRDGEFYFVAERLMGKKRS